MYDASFTSETHFLLKHKSGKSSDYERKISLKFVLKNLKQS